MHNFTTPKIYVADLAAYNAGHLRGLWLYLPEYNDVDELMDEIDGLLNAWDYDLLDGMTGPVEEWAVHDHEGLPSSLAGEYPGRAGLRKMLYFVDLLEECRAPGAAKYFVNHYAADRGRDPEEWLDYFRQAYRGTYDDPEDWAREYMEMTGMLDNMPDNLRWYFDYEAFARDVRMGGDMDFARDGRQVHAFDGHI